MAGRNNQRNPMRGQGQVSRGSRYDQYGEIPPNEGSDYQSESYGGSEYPQGPDWSHQGQGYGRQAQRGSPQDTGPYGMQGSGYGPHNPQAGDERWEPSGQGG